MNIKALLPIIVGTLIGLLVYDKVIQKMLPASFDDDYNDDDDDN